MPGILYLCATPIGNLQDMSFRVLETLKSVDLIAAEDTRNSIKLLNHYDIHTPMTSYHEFNKYDKANVLIDELKGGKNIALITDAGTPAISDPGEDVLDLCTGTGVLPLLMSAKTEGRHYCGLEIFIFEGFLPKEKKERKEVLKSLEKETRTVILYEAPHHLKGTLKELQEALGDREIVLCRELTKKFEEAVSFTISSAAEYYESHEPKGEYVLVIRGMDEEELSALKKESFENMTIAEHVAMYEAQGLERKEAMKKAATDRGISKRDVYQALLI